MTSTSTILATENQDWGFWGTISNFNPEYAAPIQQAWPLAFTAIQKATKAEPHAVRAFLDSRYGRHFADLVNDWLYRGSDVEGAIGQTTALWMAWRITQGTSRDTGIPAGMPYLTGFVINEGIAAAGEVTA